VEAHPGVKARKHSHTWAVPEVAARREESWGIQDSCCASLQRMQHLPLAVLAELVPPGLSALTGLQLVAAVGRPVLESVMMSSGSSAAGKVLCTSVA